jgi:hypothetical protein
MMRRIWAAIAATVSVVSVFTVLALAQRPFQAASPQPTQTVLARAANGALIPVTVAPAGSVHATTQTSPASATAGTSPAGQPVTYVKTASGNFVPVHLPSTPQTHATTRTS